MEGPSVTVTAFIALLAGACACLCLQALKMRGELS